MVKMKLASISKGRKRIGVCYYQVGDKYNPGFFRLTDSLEKQLTKEGIYHLRAEIESFVNTLPRINSMSSLSFNVAKGEFSYGIYSETRIVYGKM
jgi:hypothetical protein